MINIVLFVIGIVFIGISFIMTTKSELQEDNLYKEIMNKHKQIELYTNTMEDIIEKLENVFNSKEEEIKHSKSVVEDINTSVTTNSRANNHNVNHVKNSVHGEIYNLYKNGMSINEIAKKLNRGKREIDIILKMKDDDSE